MKVVKLFSLFIALYLYANIVYADDLFNNRFKGDLSFMCDFPLIGNTSEQATKSRVDGFNDFVKYNRDILHSAFVINKQIGGKEIPTFFFTGRYRFYNDSISLDFTNIKVLGANRYKRPTDGTVNGGIALGNNFELMPLLHKFYFSYTKPNSSLKFSITFTPNTIINKYSGAYKGKYTLDYYYNSSEKKGKDSMNGSCELRPLPLASSDLVEERVMSSKEREDFMGSKEYDKYRGDIDFSCYFPIKPTEPTDSKNEVIMSQEERENALYRFFAIHHLGRPNILLNDNIEFTASGKSFYPDTLKISGHYFYPEDFIKFDFADDKILGSSNFATDAFGLRKSNYMELAENKAVKVDWARLAPYPYNSKRYFDIGIYSLGLNKKLYNGYVPVYLGYYDRKDPDSPGFENRDYILGDCKFIAKERTQPITMHLPSKPASLETKTEKQ